jgi:hypothetical protein
MDWFHLVTNDGYCNYLVKSSRSNLTNQEVNSAMRKMLKLERVDCLPFYVKSSFSGEIPNLDEFINQ